MDEEILQEITRRIVDAIAPEKIILFGSAARGQMGSDSDIDLLVVKAGVNKRKTAQLLYRTLFGIAVPIDIIVVLPEDIEKHKDTLGLIYRPALTEGKILYAA